ncbi:MAG: exodeoxyribonuclease V subunit beta [Desulfobulbaceae bacterium]|jgi:exodeoxyribonuclease V beta subunit|nr:exodeoxyribonuclease V subunit beta [Desulfobulbaceae bacterium]
MSDLLSKKLTGFHLIDASAGTGKTYTITGLVVRLLLEKGYGLSEILIVTYTEAAAQDLRKRVRGILVAMRQGYELGTAEDQFVHDMLNRTYLDPRKCEKCIQLALNDFDESAIFTIHSFCQRTLKENGLESGMDFDVELEKDMGPYLHQVAGDYWRGVSVSLSPGFLRYCGTKLQPETLAQSIGQFRSGVDIIPAVDPATNGTGAEERYAQGLQHLARAWAEYREPLFSLLHSQKSLKGGSYKPEKYPLWFAELDTFFAGGGEPPACFQYFTTSGLQKFLKKNCPPVEHPFFDLAEGVAADWQALQDTYHHHLLYLQRRFYLWAEEELRRVKEDEGILSFDDLLVRTQQGLTTAGGAELATKLRAQYPAILIDEFQDTDPVQFEIFKAIHAGTPDHLLYLIGDPKQAIYNFRGADIFAYLQAAATVENRQSLTHNYRSEEGLIRGVNHLFGVANPFLIEDILFEPVLFPNRPKETLQVVGDDPAPVHILFGEREPVESKEGSAPAVKLISAPLSRDHVAIGCCAEITRLLDLSRKDQATIGTQPVQPQDIAVLVRENKEARYLQRLLRDHGVASVVKDNENIFGAPEAQELYLILQGVAAWRDQRALIPALATDCLGKTAMELYLLQDDDDGFDDIMSRFHQYHELWQERGFMLMFRTLLDREEVRQRLLSQVNGERSLTNILHLGEILHKQALKNPSVSGLLEFFKTHLAGDKKDDEFEQRLESDSKRLQILTIHKSKGLEFPIVFCPFLWKGLRSQADAPLFHTADSDRKLTMDLGSDDLAEHKRLAQFEDMAESMRLAYVAVTRATNRCIINWGPYYSCGTSALGYLLHSDGAGFEQVGKQLNGCTDGDLLEVVQGVAGRSGGTIAVLLNQTIIPPLPPQFQAGGNDLSLPHFQADLDRDFQITSFSRLTSGQHHESLIVDRDQTDAGESALSSPALTLFDFPRGAKPGTFLHYLFEHLDFGDLGSERSLDFITRALGQFGYEEQWLPVMQSMLADVCKVVLPDQDFCLGDVLPKERLNELEFHFPLTRVSSSECGALFRKHGGAGGEPWYAQLEGYGFQLMQGFLKGFVDLVFSRDDRYYIVDWKSNYLGNTHSAYGVEQMTESMIQAGYILQYHLYSLALHRYLSWRLADYDYERHFGGVFYVYLRGVSRDNNSTGVFWDRPSLPFMTDLDELFTASEDKS